MKFNTKLQIIPALVALAWGGSASAAGFQLQNQNGAGTGLAYAGAAAVAEDASTIFFNPAGMTYLPEGHSFSLGGTLIDRSVKFSDTGTTLYGGTQPLGDNGGNGGKLSLVPNFYYSYAINQDLRVGLGVSLTYGSETKYSDSFMGRFSATGTSIHQVNINPSLAYRVNQIISLGFGVNYAKNDTLFEYAAPTSATTSSNGSLKGGDSAWGYNLGTMLNLTETTRVGVAYRSSIKLNLTGKQVVSALGVDRDIYASLETPSSFSIALNQRISPKSEILADATRTNWSSIQALTPYVTATGALALPPVNYNFKNVWRFGLGMKHQYTEKLSLRAGVALDKTPVPNSESRTMTIPDADRTWLAFGARYAFDKKLSLDLGYAHIFFKDVSTARVITTTAGAYRQTINGDFKTSANLLSAQLNYNF